MKYAGTVFVRHLDYKEVAMESYPNFVGVAAKFCSVARAILSRTFGLVLALPIALAAFQPITAIAGKCESLAPGLIVGYYFDGNEMLVAVERMDGNARDPEKKANAKAEELIFKNLNRIVPDSGSNGGEIDVKNLGAKTALYLQFVQDEESPKAAVCVEDVEGVSRNIMTALKINPRARGQCNCQLVWCGRYKCCPC